MKINSKCFLILIGLAGFTLRAQAGPPQTAQTSSQMPANAPVSNSVNNNLNNNVVRTSKAGNYRRAGTSTKVAFHGTEMMPGASGEAKVSNKGNRIEIEAQITGLEDATKFGLEYLTYVFWVISPEGRAENMGELALNHGAGSVKAITTMQMFGMVVTAEPYFAVTQPGNLVVAENVLGAQSAGGVESIDAKYELLPRGAYSSSNTKIENAIFGIDPKTPREMFEARNAVRIARVAQADKYASSTFANAEQQLQTAEDTYRRKSDRKIVESAARDVVQTAEEARVMAVKRKAEDDAQARALAEKQAAEQREATARAQAAEEAHRRQQAEESRIVAEQARIDAERIRMEAELAAQNAARQQVAAEQAAAEAARQADAAQLQMQAAQDEAARQAQAAQLDRAAAQQQLQAAQADADKARQAAAQAEADKAALRKQLFDQLNSVLQTRDSARGLIVNMSDVLFDTGSYTLRPGAREKLAKVSGIVLAHPGLNLQIEGHTDSVGNDGFNQQLSEHRAASVRDFLLDQGLTPSSISARGFGKTQPVATNDTSEGRQRNRRVEIVVNGDAIGAGAASASISGAQSQQPDLSTR